MKFFWLSSGMVLTIKLIVFGAIALIVGLVIYNVYLHNKHKKELNNLYISREEFQLQMETMMKGYNLSQENTRKIIERIKKLNKRINLSDTAIKNLIDSIDILANNQEGTKSNIHNFNNYKNVA